MIELKRVLAPIDDTPFEEICSFETENYIGIFVENPEKFIVVPKRGEFEIISIGFPKSLQDMDEKTYQETGERIASVSTSRILAIKIDE